MKFSFYAEKNNGVWYALPHERSVDTVKNGWLLKDVEYSGKPISKEYFDAESCGGLLFIAPKGIGSGDLFEYGIDAEICISKANTGYSYKNLPIEGGGYVTGFAFDDDGWLFCRTDIGGCYSCEPPHKRWTPLSHNASLHNSWLCSPLSLTCRGDKLYVLFGDQSGSFVGVSENKGESFEFYSLPAFVHGNCSGRSTGERIAVTADKIFVGTRGGGLLCSTLKMDKWEKLPLSVSGSSLFIFKNRNEPRAEILDADDITFVRAVSDDIIVVGTASEYGVFVSYDGGMSFMAIEDQPFCTNADEPGFVSQRCAVCGDLLFVTYSRSLSDKNSPWYSYACDGGMVSDGCVIRFRLVNGRYCIDENVTPPGYSGGFSGIDISADGAVLVCSSVCGAPDNVYLSRDLGENWTEVLTSEENAVQEFDVPYMKPENNNGQSVIHWMSDIRLDPRDSRSAYINTGTGVFRTTNLGDKITVWKDFSGGIEETVHLDICSPASGAVRVITAVGDLGGFSFTDINRKCDFTFRDENKNRFITAINVDFAEKRPEIAVTVPRGNWIGTSKGGLAISFDGGINWRRMSDPLGINSLTDELLKRIEKPNIDPGFAAVSCDGKNVIRQVMDFRRHLPAVSVFVTCDYGESWGQSRFFDEKGDEYTSAELSVRVYADRCDERIFYAFGSSGELFISSDGGFTFKSVSIGGELPADDFSLVDWPASPGIRVSPHKKGEILMCFADHGIFRITFNNTAARSERILPEARCRNALCGGWGKGGLLYFCGTVDGIYGFWRSLNGDFIRVNTDSQQFGEIHSICGDPRAYGRFYIATGSFGGIYGQINTENK